MPPSPSSPSSAADDPASASASASASESEAESLAESAHRNQEEDKEEEEGQQQEAEEEDDDGEESSEQDEDEDEEADEDAQPPPRKQRKLDASSAHSTQRNHKRQNRSENEPNAATTDALHSKDSSSPLPPLFVPPTDESLQYHFLQLRRVSKSLRQLHVARCVRRMKQARLMGAPADTVQQMEGDHQFLKQLPLDELSLYGWRMYNLHLSPKQIRWNAHQHTGPMTMDFVTQRTEAQGMKETTMSTATDASTATTAIPTTATPAASTPPSLPTVAPSSPLPPRLKSLLLHLLHSSAAKKHFESYFQQVVRRERKGEKRARKLERIKAASAKRHEREVDRRMKREERRKENMSQNNQIESKTAEQRQVEEEEEDAKADAHEREEKRAQKVARRAATKEGMASVQKDEGDVTMEPGESHAASDENEREDGEEHQQQRKDGIVNAHMSANDGRAPSSSSAPPPPLSLSSKPSRLFGGLRVGQVVHGVVCGVERFGLFIDFVHAGKERRGMAHVSMISDAFIRDIQEEYAVGDALTAIVTRIDEKQGKISLGCKASLFPPGRAPKLLKLSQTARPLGAKGAGGEGGQNRKVESLFLDSLHEGKKQQAQQGSDPRLATIKKYLFQVAGKRSRDAERHEQEHDGPIVAETDGSDLLTQLQANSLKKNPKGKTNRLGQRERRKLIAAVLGPNAMKRPLSASEHHPSAHHSSAPHEAVPLWQQRVREAHEAKRAESKMQQQSQPQFPQELPGEPSENPRENRRMRRARMRAQDGEGAAPPPAAAAAVASNATSSTTPVKSAPAAAPRSSTPSIPRPSSTTAAPAPAPVDPSLHPSWQAKQIQAAKAAAAPQGKKVKLDLD